MVPCLTARSRSSLVAGSMLSTKTYLPSFSTNVPASAARLTGGPNHAAHAKHRANPIFLAHRGAATRIMNDSPMNMNAFHMPPLFIYHPLPIHDVYKNARHERRLRQMSD